MWKTHYTFTPLVARFHTRFSFVPAFVGNIDYSLVFCLTFQIQARGLPNPFLAKPFVNIQIPVNTTFSPLIHLYNPFATPLQVSKSCEDAIKLCWLIFPSSLFQILEMFGSSCDLHLEMPMMSADADSETLDRWIIPPHQSKAVAKVNFLAMRAVNLTAFVRYRVNGRVIYF